MKRTMRSASPVVILLLASVAALGCGSQDDTRPARWSYISTAIVQPSCATANCHSVLSQRSGAQLDGIRTGYYQLIARNFVLPGRPADSALMGLIEGQGSRRMPPDFPLPKDDINLISKWIANGAPWDGPGSAPVAAVVTPGPSDASAGN